LAVSSRNLRLSEKSQKTALKIYQNLLQIKQKIISSNSNNLNQILLNAKEEIENSTLNSNVIKIDYLEVCDEENLQILNSYNSAIKSRLFIAIYVDKIRLIDNIEL
jgi:pantoate--beta-alanine ligase